MDSKHVSQRIEEFRKIREPAGNEEPALLEVVLFIEDVFGLVLTDDEICEDNVGTYEKLKKFVTQKLEELPPVP